MNIIIRTLAAASVVLGTQGCMGSRPELRDSGINVQVTGEAAVSQCEYIGPVTSRVGANFGTYEGNVEYATNDVRNQAGDRGATHLVLAAPIKDDKTTIGLSDCNNCVALTGQAYRCSESSNRTILPAGMGAERGECYPNNTCNAGLSCLSNLCVRPAPIQPGPQ